MFQSKYFLLAILGLLFLAITEAQDTTDGGIGEDCSVVKAIDIYDVNATREVFESQAARLGMMPDDIYLHPTVVNLIEEVKAAGTDEDGNPIATLDTYYCSKTSMNQGEILIQYAVCNSQTTPTGCWVKAFFHDAECLSASLCSTEDMDNDTDADPMFTSDCTGVYEDYPDCQITCGQDEDDTCGLNADMTGSSSAASREVEWMVMVLTLFQLVLWN